jgi:Mn2+/Fe2+ NRAMP family transporter
VADDEPVLAPDQLKPGHGKSARIGAVITIAVLLLMLLGNHPGRVEDAWLIGLAVVLAAILVVDWVMRRNGIRR